VSESDQQHLEGEASGFLWEVHKYTNEYIRFADTKAAFIVGACSALIGSLVASSIFDGCFKSSLCQWTSLQWTGAVGLLLLATSLGFCLAAIRPRLWNNTSIGFIFWGSITGHGRAQSFTRAVHGLSAHERSSAISDHLFMLATIVRRKYMHVDRALIAGVAGGALTAAVLFAQHAWR